MPMVTIVIGFHFGFSTGSLPLTRATMQIERAQRQTG